MRTAVPICLALLLGVASANDLCTSPPEGLSGAFDPTTDVPKDVLEALTDAFFETFGSGAGSEGEAFTGCAKYQTDVRAACSQVAKGVNYRAELLLTCEGGEIWDNGAMTVSFVGEASAPGGGKPVEVTFIGPASALPMPVMAPAECPTPYNYTVEGFAPVPTTDVPVEVLSALASDWLETATFDGKEFPECKNLTTTATDACTKEGEDSETVFDVTFSVTCNDEDLEWAEGIETVYLLGVASVPTNGTIEVYTVELVGALPKPPKPLPAED